MQYYLFFPGLYVKLYKCKACGRQMDLPKLYAPVIDGLYFDVESFLVNLLVFMIGKQKKILATACLSA